LHRYVEERLRGIYPGAGGGQRVPRDDDGLVEVIKAHAKLLGIRWPKVGLYKSRAHLPHSSKAPGFEQPLNL
jgi:hypothetical protein